RRLLAVMREEEEEEEQDDLLWRNIYFRKLREKPVLTSADICDRYAFAKKYRGKSKRW
ncbi:unnamed protein product, partial [Symbiodinium necroappetens]